ASLFLFIIAFNISLFARNIDIDAIVKNSVKKDKHLFIFLHRTDCGYCESMLMFTLDDDPVKELINKDFVYLHINISEDDVVKYKNFKGSGRDFAKHVGYNLYPSSLFLNAKNEIIHAVPGYQDKDQFLVVLQYVNRFAYKTMGYQSFKKKMDTVK
ncbi:MAG: thioredoxin fold domain-containing protein, partial [Sulfuricurvum sp.]|nr:thioredoxin fold domain-containing protein [Sulfuricurvum sp.]